MDNFIMLPNKIVWNNEDNKNTYLNQYGDKILYILAYLNGVTNRFGKTLFTIKDMIITCGMTPKSGSEKLNEQFKNILNSLKDKGIIETDKDFNEIKINDYISCVFNNPIEKNSNDNNIKFFPITIDNYLEIVDRYKGKLNKLTLLKVYYYINARISRRENIEVNGKKMNVDDIVIHGGKANCFYDKYTNICKDLAMSEEKWNEYIKELNKMELIFYGNIGKVKNNKGVREANNVYCVNINEMDEALKQSKLYYKDEGYEILGKKTKKTTTKKKQNSEELSLSQLYGKKGTINRKIKNNKASEEDLLELKMIEQKIEELKSDPKETNKDKNKKPSCLTTTMITEDATTKTEIISELNKTQEQIDKKHEEKPIIFNDEEDVDIDNIKVDDTNPMLIYLNKATENKSKPKSTDYDDVVNDIIEEDDDDDKEIKNPLYTNDFAVKMKKKRPAFGRHFEGIRQEGLTAEQEADMIF